MYALIVTLQVKPDKRAQFLAAAEDDSTCSVRDEPGCVRFDVLHDNEDENRYYFYEVYRDEDAFKAHGTMPHFTRWRAASQECVESISRGVATVLFPADYR